MLCWRLQAQPLNNIFSLDRSINKTDHNSQNGANFWNNFCRGGKHFGIFRTMKSYKKSPEIPSIFPLAPFLLSIIKICGWHTTWQLMIEWRILVQETYISLRLSLPWWRGQFTSKKDTFRFTLRIFKILWRPIPHSLIWHFLWIVHFPLSGMRS